MSGGSTVKKLCLSVVLWTATLAGGSAAHAIDEADYGVDYYDVVEPWCEQHRRISELEGVDGIPIRFVEYDTPSPLGALVVFPGRTETFLKYCELAYDLKDLGFAIYMMDHRGQGLSGRMLKDSEKGYVRDFDDYVDDMRTFVTNHVAPKHERLFAIAHSMGGAALTLLEQRYDLFDAAVLSAPMLQINTAPYPGFVANAITGVLSHVGKANDYTLGEGPYDPELDRFETNSVTHSRARFTSAKQQWLDDPSLALGGPTNQWVHRSILATREARAWAVALDLSVLMLQAENDAIVVNSGQNWVCAWARDCEKVIMPGSFHEVLMETDAIRDLALERLRAFLLHHATR